ncbi:MAG TPA: class I adenylate-forming enzyme family protein [Acidimicrobiales bacterium]|nr:class I adenylate-forming enzyme family protein [Acidimicrobiales bacterium]
MPRQLLIGDVFRAAARATPGRIAAALGDRQLSFKELDEASNRLARALMRRRLSAGDRVASWSRTSLETVPVFAALAKMGTVFAPLSPLWGKDEGAQVLSRLRPNLVLVDDSHHEEALFVGSDLGFDVISLDDLTLVSGGEASTEPDFPGALSETDPHVVFFTSGSSGPPKGAVLSHRANVLRTLPGALLEPRGAMVCPYPLFHMGAWTIALQQWQARDAVVFVHSADAEEIVTAVERHRATRLNCVPAVWARLLRTIHERPLSSVRFADTGTSATPPELLSSIASALPGACVRVFYGSTEAGGVTLLEQADFERKPGSCGVPGPLTEVKLDADGGLLIRGPLVFDGYLDDEAATSEAMVDGWYRTGDLAEIDDEGYISIIGRLRDVIRTGGETVSPLEVEDVLKRHSAISDVAVVGVPDVEWGEVVCAVIVVAPGEDEPRLEDLRSICTARLATYKHPRRVVVVDAIPRTSATGQVQRRILVERIG